MQNLSAMAVPAEHGQERDAPGVLLVFQIRLSPRPAAQHLRHAPGLSNAAARCMRPLSIEDFTDRADPRFIEMGGKPVQKRARLLKLVRMNFQPGINEWSDQPGPDRSLVIGRVAGLKIA